MSEQATDTPPNLGGNLIWVWIAARGGGDLRRVRRVWKRRFAKYVCHLSKTRWETMRAKHQGDDLAEALRRWAKGFRRTITHVGIIGD